MVSSKRTCTITIFILYTMLQTLCFYYILYIFMALRKWQNFALHSALITLQLPMDHTVLLIFADLSHYSIFVLVRGFDK